MAAFNGQRGYLRIPVEGKANLDIPNKDDVTPTLAAAQEGNNDWLRILVESKANLD